MARSGLVEAKICGTEKELSEHLKANEGPFKVRIGMLPILFPDSSGKAQLVYDGKGLVEYEPKDQVAVFDAGTPISEVQRILSKHQQCVPLRFVGPVPTKTVKVPESRESEKLISVERQKHGTTHVALGEVLSSNFPAPGEAVFGNFRDWVLGLTVVLANGEVIACGSKAVKSVAGYDLHKLFIGAQHSLGIVTRVIFRTYPLSQFENTKLNCEIFPSGSEPLPPTPLTSQGAGEGAAGKNSGLGQNFVEPGGSVDKAPPLPVRSSEEGAGGRGSEEGPSQAAAFITQGSSCVWIQRTRRTDFEAALSAAKPGLMLADHDSCILWANTPEPLPRYPHDWVLHKGNLEIENPFQRKLMLKMKRKLDPTNKLNPGAFGLL